MTAQDPSPLDRLRQPEYTGDNRCHPCTVLNVIIAVLLSAVVGRKRKPLGAVVLAGSLAAIYLRGYLVPGTPELTKRYLPASVRRKFGKDPVADRLEDEFVTDVEPTGSSTGSASAEESGADGADADEADEDEADNDPTFETLEKIEAEREQSVDAEAFLEERGVIEPAADDQFDYDFTDEFRAAARERIPEDSDAVGSEELAPLFDAEPGDLTPKDRDYPAYSVGVRVRKWPTATAQALDVATFEALADWTDEWADVPMEQRLDVLEWLRGFYDECPACGGAVTFSDDVIESCCGQFDVTTLSCTDCGVHLREFDPTKVGTREELKGIVP